METKQRIKTVEIWRNPDGSFAPEPKPEPVKEVSKEDGNVVIGMLMLGMVALSVLVIFWQFTLVTLASAGAGYGVRKFYQTKSDPNRLIVNHY